MNCTETWLLDASVIVCTRNRAAKLNNALSSFGAMKHDGISFEIIVVDDGSNDHTGDVVAKWLDLLPVRYVREAGLGLSNARNVGLSNCAGKLVFFTDDDCIVATDWLLEGVRLLSANPRSVIGGRVDLHDTTDLPLTIRVDTTPSNLSSVADLLGFMHGCNMAFGRCVIDEIGSFDKLLGAGTRCKAAEDTDFAYRAFRRGIPVLYRPEFRVAHDHGRKRASEEAVLTDGYAVSVGAIVLKHLLRGDNSLMKLAYWTFLGEDSSGKRRLAASYSLGAFNYARSLAFR